MDCLTSKDNSLQWKSNLHILSHEEICKWKICNWKYNRPVDNTRIQSIIDYIKNTGNVEGIIYLAKYKNGHSTEYAIYDGIHRLSALKMMYKSQFDDMLGITKYNVLVDIMDYDDERIKQRFIGINSSVPVSELYTEIHQSYDNLKNIQFIAQFYKEKYSCFFTNKQNYRLPNINDNVFIGYIGEILTNENILEHIQHRTGNYTPSIDDYMNIIEDFHQSLRERPKQNKVYKWSDKNIIKIQPKQLEKCEKHDMYLFCVMNWLSEFESFLQNV